MATAEAVELETIAELLEQLGVAPERVMLQPPPGTAVEEDVLRQKRPCELIDGVMVEKAIGWKESYLASILIYLIQKHLESNRIGMVLGEHGLIQLFPGSVRIPDVSFVSWKRMRAPKSIGKQILNVAPDLAVEILSPSNSSREMERKREDYFCGGCTVVWEADPPTRTVTVFTSPTNSTVIDESGVLTCESVLPGFQLPVREWFDRAEPPSEFDVGERPA